jgi:hypothetical protein
MIAKNDPCTNQSLDQLIMAIQWRETILTILFERRRGASGRRGLTSRLPAR